MLCQRKETVLSMKHTYGKKGAVTLLLLLLSALFLLSSCAKGNGDAPEGMKLASGEAVDYDLYVPENWTVTSQTGFTSAYYSTRQRTNISLAAYSREDNMTVEEYWLSYTGPFSEVYHDFTVIEETDCTLGGVIGKKYTYKGTFMDVSFQFMQMICIRSGNIYVLTYTATADEFDECTEDFNMMVENFRFR